MAKQRRLIKWNAYPDIKPNNGEYLVCASATKPNELMIATFRDDPINPEWDPKGDFRGTSFTKSVTHWRKLPSLPKTAK